MTSEPLIAGSYNYGLVALSILIAMLGSYAALNLAGRVKANHTDARFFWLLSGATAMAIGTWAMHYTGMLAFRLAVPIEYDLPTSLLSFVPSFLASAVAMLVVIRPKMKSPRAILAGFFIGAGIAALHYTGMESMRFQGMHRYSPALVVLSVLLAMLFALFAVWLMFLFRDEPRGWKLRKAAAVALMGTAIWAMHYTGMASAAFVETGIAPNLSHAVSISLLGALGIGAVSVMVLVVTLMTATLDRIQKANVLQDELFEQAPQAVALMSADYHIVRVNREFIKVFGFTSEEAVGRDARELILPEEKKAEAREFIARLERGERVEAESVRQRRDGTIFPVSILHVPISLPGGEVARYAIYRDITERKQAEAQIKATTEQLRALSASLQEAKEKEATRIAREIHDELGGALTSLKWDLEAFNKATPEGATQTEEERRQKIASMIKLIDTTIDSVRRISSELRPSVLDDLGLAETIKWQARQFQSQTGIVCICDCDADSSDLSGEQSTALFRIFQEALTNVLRHAQASAIQIQLRRESGQFVMRISDNGRGITEEESAGKQTLGLLGMRERAHLVGARIEITGAAGVGTVVTVTITLG
jgi:two-component system sensor histidine kinase UhpB